MTFEEEQGLLKQTATELLLFVHQRQESYHIRNLTTTGKLEVSSENVQKLIMLYDLLGIDKAKISAKLKNLLAKAAQVVESEGHLKDCNDYFKESLPIVTEVRKCQNCGKSLENTTAKAKFCSNSCRVQGYRAKKA